MDRKCNLHISLWGAPIRDYMYCFFKNKTEIAPACPCSCNLIMTISQLFICWWCHFEKLNIYGAHIFIDSIKLGIFIFILFLFNKRCGFILQYAYYKLKSEGPFIFLNDQLKKNTPENDKNVLNLRLPKYLLQKKGNMLTKYAKSMLCL